MSKKEDERCFRAVQEITDPVTGKKIVPKLLEGVATPGGTVDPDDPDSVIPVYITEMGLKIVNQGPFASPVCVQTFFLSQMCFVDNIDRVLFRLMGERGFSDSVTKTPLWKDARNPHGNNHVFSGRFWARLFNDVSCYMSREYAETFEDMKKVNVHMKDIGLYPEDADKMRSAIFAWIFSCNLGHKNILSIVEDDSFMNVVMGGKWNCVDSHNRGVLAKRFVAAIMDLKGSSEDMWVALMATSTFRKIPFVPQTFKTRMLPMIYKEEEKQEEPIPASLPELIPIVPELIPIVKEEVQPIQVPEKVPEKVTLPKYTKFESVQEELPIFVQNMRDMYEATKKTTVALVGKGRMSAIIDESGSFSNKKFDELVTRYRVAAGFSSMMDKRRVLTSMIVSLLAGDDVAWKEAHDIVFDNKNSARIEARSELVSLDPDVFMWILAMIIVGDRSDLKPSNIPPLVVQEIMDFFSKLNPVLPVQNRVNDLYKMLHIFSSIYYDPKTWKSRWANFNIGVSNETIVEKINEILMTKKTISPTMRAFLITSSISLL